MPQHKAYKRTQVEAEHNLPSNDLAALPNILISLETRNDSANIFPFFQSLANQTYPKTALSIAIVDRGSQDDTLERLKKAKSFFGGQIRSFQVTSHPEITIGAAHNQNFKSASENQFVLVCSPSVILEPDALSAVMGLCKMSAENVAAWELRQTPSESSKLYSPSNLETSWASARCALFRLKSVIEVGGFEDKALRAGEDVELSYRLRDSGYRLLYAPQATFWAQNDSENEALDIEPSIESQLSNLFIRMRYGSTRQKLAIPKLLYGMWRKSKQSKRDRTLFLHALNRIIKFGPKFITSKRTSSRIFPICGWNYEFMRTGKAPRRPMGLDITHPKVSIVIRKHYSHNGFLLETIRSIANQSYPNLEIIVIDKTEEAKSEAVLLNRLFGPDITIKFIQMDGANAATAANRGIAESEGEFVLILNDDNLLFADHVEQLVSHLNAKKSSIAYSFAMESRTEIRTSDPFIYLEQTSSHQTSKQLNRTQLWKEDCLPLACVILRKSTLKDQNLFDPELSSAADWDFLVRLSLSEEFECLPRTTILLRKELPNNQNIGDAEIYKASLIRAQTKQSEYTITLSPAEILKLQSEVQM